MASVRNVVESCLDEGGTISVREDVLGVYGDDNPQDRSVSSQLSRIQNDDFVRIALITVRPTGSTAGQDGNLQRDLDNANRIYRNECGLWLYPVGSRVVNTDFLGSNVLLDQDDCNGNGHGVSDEEDDLFDLGRDMGADIVCYYINGSTGGAFGCAAHPDGRRGFWAANSSPSRTRWTFAHELIHIVGDNDHLDDTDNLMYGSGTNSITNPPPDLTDSQCGDIEADEDVEHC